MGHNRAGAQRKLKLKRYKKLQKKLKQRFDPFPQQRVSKEVGEWYAEQSRNQSNWQESSTGE